MTNFFASLHNKRKYSDITLLIGSSKIFAHKVILSSCSDYFKTMFDSAFKESTEKIVTIKKDDEELFKMMIEIIYTNEAAENLSLDVAFELTLLAQKYLVDELVKFCRNVLIEKMTLENCLDILLFADHLQSTPFRDRVLRYIRTQLDTVSKTKRWETLEIDNPQFINEITSTIPKPLLNYLLQ
jgi:hypothetical protein